MKRDNFLFFIQDCNCKLYFTVRFNNGPNTNAGGLEVFEESSQKWYGICDTGFDDKAALVACRSIKGTYVDARTIPGKLVAVLNI